MSSQRHIYKPAATRDDDKTHRDDDEKASSSFWNRMNNPVVFSIFSLLATSVGVAGIVYQSASVTTMERRFQLKSQHTAILPIVTDAVGVLTLLFLVHYASSRHRPRYMSCCLMMTGLGFSLYSVPHFLYPMPPLLQSYQVGDINGTTLTYHTAGTDDVCSDGNSAQETCSVEEVKESGTLFNQAFWLFMGASIAGLSTCFYPLYIVHIDDGVEKKKLPIYLGMLFAIFGSGGLIGYGLAIVCLQIPAYITEPEFRKLTPYDPGFLGAWWLGFLILGILQVVLALPIFFFPKFLPKPKLEENGSVDDKDMTAVMIQSAKFEVAREEGETYLSGLVKSIWRVLSRPTLVFCFLCYIALSAYFAGFSIFGPKYLQIQFSINPYQTAMIFAILMLPPGIFGNLAGGIVVRIFGETRTKIALIVIILGVIVMSMEVFFLWFGCQNGDIAGLTVPYQLNEEAMMDMELPNLEVGCHEGCGCKDQYNPVCGSDGLTYATACFAGCRSHGKTETGDINSTVYLDCACIPSPGNVTFYSEGGEVLTDTSYAVLGACPNDPPCQFLVPYLVLSLLIWTGGTMIANPIVILQIRSVDLPDRPMCIAVGNILGKLFGVLPAPAIYGAIIDSACLMFQSSCGQSGNCVVYDIEKYRYTFNGLNLLMRVIGTVFLFLAYLSVKLGWDAKKKNRENQNHTEKEPMKMESTI